jgi:general stress protein 26
MSEEFKNFKAEIWRHLGDQYVFLATGERDQPRVRPVTLVNFDQKLWVLTETDSAKVRQIRESPKIEFCLLFEEGGHHGYLRGAGFAKIIEDGETKTRLARHCDFFREHWESPDDPNYTLLELQLREVEYLRSDESRARKCKL